MSSNKRTELKRIRSQYFQLIADLHNEHKLLLEPPHDLGSDKECVYCRQFHTIQVILQEKSEELLYCSDRIDGTSSMNSRHKLTEKELVHMKRLKDKGFTKEAIAELMGVSRSTVFRNLSKLENVT